MVTRKEFEKQKYLKGSRYYVEEIIPESVKDSLMMKGIRMGKSITFEEAGAGTEITVIPL